MAEDHIWRELLRLSGSLIFPIANSVMPPGSCAHVRLTLDISCYSRERMRSFVLGHRGQPVRAARPFPGDNSRDQTKNFRMPETAKAQSDANSCRPTRKHGISIRRVRRPVHQATDGKIVALNRSCRS